MRSHSTLSVDSLATLLGGPTETGGVFATERTSSTDLALGSLGRKHRTKPGAFPKSERLEGLWERTGMCWVWSGSIEMFRSYDKGVLTMGSSKVGWRWRWNFLASRGLAGATS